MATWETYVICDTAFFASLSCYAVIRLICAAVHSQVSYVCRVILRSLSFALAFSVSLSFLVSCLNPSAPGQDVFQFFVILFAAAVCLSFFFAIQEWDAICRAVQFRPCQLDVFMIVIILVIGMTGICQLCTYFIRTNASPYVFFFLNSFTVFVQMGFVLGYGCFRISILLRALNPMRDSRYLTVVQRIVTGLTAVLGVVVLFEFAAFVAAFCVNLDHQPTYHLFTVFCVRIPVFCSVLSAILFQDMMDLTAEHITNAQKPAGLAAGII
jgi:hypothetical protein